MCCYLLTTATDEQLGLVKVKAESIADSKSGECCKASENGSDLCVNAHA